MDDEQIVIVENISPVVENKTNGLSVPTAIIIAGLMIAISIFATFGHFGGNDGVKTIAQRAGLNISKFNTCLASNKYDAKITAMHKEGEAIGIDGTPFSVIIAKDGTKVPVVGAQEYNTFKGIIDGLPKVPTLDPRLAAYHLDKVSPVDPTEHIFGNPNADIKIVEYSDTECPFCKRIEPTLKKLVADYDGKVAWVYRHFPLDCNDSVDPSCQTLHAKSRHEAVATECAGEQKGNDGFWKYIDALYTATPSNDGFDAQML